MEHDGELCSSNLIKRLEHWRPHGEAPTSIPTAAPPCCPPDRAPRWVDPPGNRSETRRGSVDIFEDVSIHLSTAVFVVFLLLFRLFIGYL